MDVEKEKTMAKNEDEYEKYLGYIEDNLDEVAEKVTRIFDERKKGLAATLCGMLRNAVSCATHYEWRRGDCPYDTSGELKDCGDIDLNISIADFLEEEYTGGTKASDWKKFIESDAYKKWVIDINTEIKNKCSFITNIEEFLQIFV